MKKLFSVFFVMTVFCFGADNSVNDIAPATSELTGLKPTEGIAEINISDLHLIKKGSCTIYLDATSATEQEKEAAYQVVESAISSFEGRVPDSIGINVGISNLELIDSVSYDVADGEQEDKDRVIAVKDIKILEVIIDIACEQATQEEKSEFFNSISTVLVDLCAQLKEVANSIHGTITFDSPDISNTTKSSELDSEVVIDNAELIDHVIINELETADSIDALQSVNNNI